MDKNKDEDKKKTYPKKSLALTGNARAKKYDAPRVVHSFSLSPETLAALTAFAEREGIKKSVALERILRERLLDDNHFRDPAKMPVGFGGRRVPRRFFFKSAPSAPPRKRGFFKSSPSVSAGK